jgi:hypothetical protein
MVDEHPAATRTLFSTAGEDHIASLPTERLGWPLRGLVEACDRAGLDWHDGQLIHRGHVAGFALASQGLFVRVGRQDSGPQAENSLRFARYCTAHGLPMISPALELQRPIVTSCGPVTFWPLLPSRVVDLDWYWLGGTLAQLHAHGASAPLPLAIRTSNGQLRARRDRFVAHVTDPAVERQVDRVVRELGDCSAALASTRRSLIHGDPYKVNVVRTPGGLRLVDYDAAGIGSILLDLVPVYLYYKRFNLPAADLARFIDGYGSDPATYHQFAQILRMRELGMITYLLERAVSSAAYRAELLFRLQTIDEEAGWMDIDQLDIRDPT